MDNKKDDKYFISKVIENIDAIISYTNKCSYDEFMDDELLIDASMFRLVQMAEYVGRISESFKLAHSNIAWGEIMGFRNGIVHDYGKTDYSIVYEIVSLDIIKLKEELIKYI